VPYFAIGRGSPTDFRNTVNASLSARRQRARGAALSPDDL